MRVSYDSCLKCCIVLLNILYVCFFLSFGTISAMCFISIVLCSRVIEQFDKCVFLICLIFFVKLPNLIFFCSTVDQILKSIMSISYPVVVDDGERHRRVFVVEPEALEEQLELLHRDEARLVLIKCL